MTVFVHVPGQGRKTTPEACISKETRCGHFIVKSRQTADKALEFHAFMDFALKLHRTALRDMSQ